MKISPRQWSQINFNADVLLPGLTIPSELSQPKRIVHYNEEIFLQTVAYILSIIQEVAFGIFKVRGSDNKIYCVPANTRKISFTEAWDEYNSKFTKKERFGQERFKLMMDVLAPEKEKILNSLDSCSMKYGTNNFNLFERLINTIFFNCNNSSSSSSSSSSSILNQNFKSFLLKQNRDIETFMSKKFHSHFERNDTCLCHSFKWLFDGNKNSELNEVSHCWECDNIFALCPNISIAIDAMDLFPGNESTITLKNELFNLNNNLKHFWEHKVRTFEEKNIQSEELNNLQDDEILIITDFKMKLLVMKKRESMQEYFGKRGMPLLGFMFVRKTTESEKLNAKNTETTRKNKKNKVFEYDVKFFDCLLEGEIENGATVKATLEASLKLYKSNNNHIVKAILLTDGAGCFSGEYLFFNLPYIYYTTDIYIIKHLVFESGQGKTALDGHFSVLNVVLDREVHKGHNVMDQYDAVINLNSNGGINNSIALATTININYQQEIKKKKFSEIKKYHCKIFHFNYNTREFVSCELRELSQHGTIVKYTKEKLTEYFEYNAQLPIPATFNNPANLLPSNNSNIILSSEEKKRREQTKNKRIEINNNNVDNNNKIINNIKNNIIEEGKKKNYKFCQDSECQFRCKKKNEMTKHENSGRHSYVSSNLWTNRTPLAGSGQSILQIPLIDRLIEVGQNNLLYKKSNIDIENNSVNLMQQEYNGEYSLYNGKKITIEYKKESCLHHRLSNSQISAKQLHFVYKMYKFGEDNNNKKISPYAAEKMFYLAGTIEGQKKYSDYTFMKANPNNMNTFNLFEILDEGQIKGYFGKGKTLKNMVIKKYKDKKEKIPEDLVVKNKDDIEEDQQEEKEGEGEDDGFFESEEIIDIIEELYCICKKPNDGTLMLECESCNNWFHPACIGLHKSTTKELEDNIYICKGCTTI